MQNFRAKPTTRMASAPEPSSLDIARTIAVARLMLPDMNIQAPPNLSPYDHRLFLAAGINDWGGISPLTLDYVNPEAPWPQVAALARTCARRGLHAGAAAADLPRVHRPAGLPRPVAARARRRACRSRRSASCGMTCATSCSTTVRSTSCCARRPRRTAAILDRALAGEELIGRRGDAAARRRRRRLHRPRPRRRRRARRRRRRRGHLRRQSQHQLDQRLLRRLPVLRLRRPSQGRRRLQPLDRRRPRQGAGRDRPRRQRGLHAGRHQPGDRTRSSTATCSSPSKRASRSMHIHAFSPMEIMYGARRTGMTYRDYLTMLRDAGLGTIPGTAAEILDDDVREILSHKKVDVRTWVDIITTAHALGIRSQLDGDVRPHRDAGAHRPPPRPHPRHPEAHRRLHRVRPAALHPHPARRSTRRGWSTRRRSARSTSASTPSRASCCAAGSTTCRPRG